MRLPPGEPSPKFVVSNIPELHANAIGATDSSVTTILSLLRSMASRMACDPGRILRPLTDVARHLCGADAAGICIEREGQLVPADCLPVVIASGSCESLSGVDVPRAQSACAIAIADNQPKLFQVPSQWLPVDSPTFPTAHGITAPWRAGSQRGTLWILNHNDESLFGVSKYRTLLILASLVGSAFYNLSEQERWQRDSFAATSQSLLDMVLEQIQLPLDDIRQQIELGLRHTRGSGTESLRDAVHSLHIISERIDSLLAIQSRPIQ